MIRHRLSNWGGWDAVHFVDAEYTARLTKATASLVDLGLDALLLFAPESHYWIYSYDTFGFAMFQCMILGADGRLNLLTRAPDLRQSQKTSTLSDAQIHIWRAVECVAPAANLAVLVAKLGCRSKIAMETQTVDLTFANVQSVVSAFDQPLHIGGGITSELPKINLLQNWTCTAALQPFQMMRWLPPYKACVPARLNAIFWPICKGGVSR